MTPTSFARIRFVSALTFACAAMLPAACSLDVSGLEPGSGGSGGSSSSSGVGAGDPCEGSVTVSCYSGIAGTMGVGICTAGKKTCKDGFFSACEGEVLPAAKENCTTPLDDDCNGSVNEGCPCEPGSMEPCYMGPAGTDGVGICHAGMHTCNPDGNGFGACMGAVVPEAAENCATAEDEDCNGSDFDPLDTACMCVPGMDSSCYSGPAGTAGMGLCVAGTHTCNSDGMTFTACAGEVLPALEDCTTPADEDCDGHAFDDADSGCMCQPGSVGNCLTGQPGFCSDGTHTCNAQGTGFDTCKATAALPFDDCVTPEDDDCDGSIVAACTGTLINGGGFGNPGQGSDEIGFGVAADTAGNSIGGGVWGGTSITGYAVSTGSAFLVKAPPMGAPFFTKLFTATGGSSYAVIRAVATDSNNNIYAAGQYRGTLDLGGGACDLGGSMNTDFFVAKFDSAGNCIWGKRAGDNAFQAAYAIAVDKNGNVFITGEYGGAINAGPGCNLGNGGGGADVFVLKYDTAGVCQWGIKAGDGSDQYGWSLAATSTGDVVVTGQFAGNVNFGGGNLGNGGGIDVFVARLSAANGAQMWAKKFGAGQDQYGYGVAVDPAGNVAITGAFYGTLDLGNGALTNPNAGGSSIFLGRLNGANGNAMWSKSYDCVQGAAPGGIAVDGAGNIAMTGYFKGTINLGGGNLVNPDGTNATFDAFVAKFGSAAGASLWSRRYGDTTDQRGWMPATDGQGNVLFIGGYKGTVDLGAPIGQVTSAGGFDVLGARLAP